MIYKKVKVHIIPHIGTYGQNVKYTWRFSVFSLGVCGKVVQGTEFPLTMFYK